MIELLHRRVYSYHVDIQTLAGSLTPSIVARFEVEDDKWYLVNEGLGDASVVKGTQVAPFKLGARAELEPEIKIIFGRDERFRASHLQMICTG